MNGKADRGFDAAWFSEQLLGNILPRWVERAPTREGLFLPHFDHEWRPGGQTFGTLVSQGRLLYNFAVGCELTGQAAYREAVASGTRFLLGPFRDARHGGWLYAVNLDGTPADDHKDSYGHAFALFGLSHAARVTGDAEARAGALDVWETLNTRFRDRHGGLVSRMSRDWRDLDTRRSQNPVMHTFEALLAASEVEGLGHLLDEAERVARFVFGSLVREDGVLPELFTMAWDTLPAAEGGWTNIGHQFEWAFLLSRAVELGLPEGYLTHAERLLGHGLRLGYDGVHGGIFTGATPEGEVRSTRKGWWEQCEAIRAMLHFAVARGRDDLWEPLERTLAFVKRSFVDAEHGGWFAQAEADGQPVSAHKGSPFKLDYHQVAMCAEAIRIADWGLRIAD